jgi:quercetin dioxygenase-like cupin family protein
MDYETASTDGVDSVVPAEYGGMWFFREPLGCENLGVTLFELEPGGKGKSHDHAEDGQEEVYLVVAGELTVQLGGDGDEPPGTELTLSAGKAVRVGPGTQRQLHNHGDGTVRVVIAGAP